MVSAKTSGHRRFVERFFPIEPDDLLGWRLHRFDALTNKALAMGGRSETRDLVDIVANSEQHPLHAVIWAACAKDPGYNPFLLLNQMRRNSRVEPAELREMGAAMAPVELKERWLALAEVAAKEIVRAAAAGIETGLAFVNSEGKCSPGALIHNDLVHQRRTGPNAQPKEGFETANHAKYTNETGTKRANFFNHG